MFSDVWLNFIFSLDQQKSRLFGRGVILVLPSFSRLWNLIAPQILYNFMLQPQAFDTFILLEVKFNWLVVKKNSKGHWKTCKTICLLYINIYIYTYCYCDNKNYHWSNYKQQKQQQHQQQQDAITTPIVWLPDVFSQCWFTFSLRKSLSLGILKP